MRKITLPLMIVLPLLVRAKATSIMFGFGLAGGMVGADAYTLHSREVIKRTEKLANALKSESNRNPKLLTFLIEGEKAGYKYIIVDGHGNLKLAKRSPLLGRKRIPIQEIKNGRRRIAIRFFSKKLKKFS